MPPAGSRGRAPDDGGSGEKPPKAGSVYLLMSFIAVLNVKSSRVAIRSLFDKFTTVLISRVTVTAYIHSFIQAVCGQQRQGVSQQSSRVRSQGDSYNKVLNRHLLEWSWTMVRPPLALCCWPIADTGQMSYHSTITYSVRSRYYPSPDSRVRRGHIQRQSAA